MNLVRVDKARTKLARAQLQSAMGMGMGGSANYKLYSDERWFENGVTGESLEPEDIAWKNELR